MDSSITEQPPSSLSPITLTGPRGVSVDTCALLDNGSTRSFIDEGLSKTLGLEGKHMSYKVTTMTEKDAMHHGRELEVNLSRLWTTEFNEALGADKGAMSLEDKIALAKMKDSVRTQGDHYEIVLPWKDAQDLPCNKTHAF
ncbi:hypothetical protein CAPTEDRAFT_217581, partial [Capitella teleta]